MEMDNVLENKTFCIPYNRMGSNSSKVGDMQQVTQVTKPNTEETTHTRQMINELESDFNAIEAKKKSIKKDNPQKPQNPHKKVSYDEIQIYRHKYMPKSKTSADV
jgi:hypothetical protein